jgi:hypothetical protein
MRKQIKRVLLCFSAVVIAIIFSAVSVYASKKLKHKSPKVPKIYSPTFKQDVSILKSYIVKKYPNTSERIANKIATKTVMKCKEHNISHSLIVGLMDVESNFNPEAKSNKGARGLLQIMHGVWKDEMNIKSKKDLYDVEHNLDVGIRILKHYIDVNGGNTSKALANYSGTRGKSFSKKVYHAANRYESFKKNSNITAQ